MIESINLMNIVCSIFIMWFMISYSDKLIKKHRDKRIKLMISRPEQRLKEINEVMKWQDTLMNT